MQRSVELSLYLDWGGSAIINIHKSVSQMFIVGGLVKVLLNLSSNSWNSERTMIFLFCCCFNKKQLVNQNIPFSSDRNDTPIPHKKKILVSLRLDLCFRALIIFTFAAVNLKLNMERATEHKRVACVLFLDLYLKRSLSDREGKTVPGRGRNVSCLLLK